MIYASSPSLSLSSLSLHGIRHLVCIKLRPAVYPKTRCGGSIVALKPNEARIEVASLRLPGVCIIYVESHLKSVAVEEHT